MASTSSAPNVASASPPQSVVAPTTTTSTTVAQPVPVTPTVAPLPSVPMTSAALIEALTSATPTLSPPPPTTTATNTAVTADAAGVADSVAPSAPSSGTSQFAIGDHVRVQLELEIFRMMQEGHGGWMDEMVEVRAT